MAAEAAAALQTQQLDEALAPEVLEQEEAALVAAQVGGVADGHVAVQFVGSL